MRINHNIAALNTHRQLNTASTAQSKSMEKLSSGLRINKAGDDAAGLAISEKMRGQIRGLDMASKNAQDGISMIQTAEGALNETHDILQRMRELAVQSGNDTNTDSDRGELQKEVDQLAQEITRIANNTEFNTQTLLNGGITDSGLGKVKFQIGANKDQNISLDIKAMDAKSLGVTRDIITSSLDEDATGITKMATTTGSTLVAGTHAVTVGNVDATQSSVELGTDVTISAKAGGAYDGKLGNDIKVNLTVDNTLGADTDGTAIFDSTTNTLNIISKAGTEASINAAITASSNDDNFVVTGTGTATDVTGKVMTGADDSKLEFTIGSHSKTVATDATSVVFSDLGLTLTKDATATDESDFDDVNIIVESTEAKAAELGADGKMSQAVAQAGINISSQSEANSAVETINKAIETVSAERSKLGAVQNRLEHTINNLNTSSENLTAAESRVRDVDYALAA